MGFSLPRDPLFPATSAVTASYRTSPIPGWQREPLPEMQLLWRLQRHPHSSSATNRASVLEHEALMTRCWSAHCSGDAATLRCSSVCVSSSRFLRGAVTCAATPADGPEVDGDGGIGMGAEDDAGRLARHLSHPRPGLTCFGSSFFSADHLTGCVAWAPRTRRCTANRRFRRSWQR